MCLPPVSSCCDPKHLVAPLKLAEAASATEPAVAVPGNAESNLKRGAFGLRIYIEVNGGDKLG